MDKLITVEVLKPPEFSRTGRLIPRTEAWKLGLWYGAFNLWILRRSPEPSILYQQRSPSIGWAPSKLDVALAGHYENGEQDLKAIGRRFNVGLGTDGTVRNTVNNLFL